MIIWPYTQPLFWIPFRDVNGTDISRPYSNSIRTVWKSFYPSVSDSEYPISVTDPYPNAQKLHFYDVDIHYNLIRQKLTLSVSDSVFEHKYENKYNISDIRPYPIRFHP